MDFNSDEEEDFDEYYLLEINKVSKTFSNNFRILAGTAIIKKNMMNEILWKLDFYTDFDFKNYAVIKKFGKYFLLTDSEEKFFIIKDKDESYQIILNKIFFPKALKFLGLQYINIWENEDASFSDFSEDSGKDILIILKMLRMLRSQISIYYI